MHLNITCEFSGTVLSQKATRVTVAEDMPKLPSGQSVGSMVSAASAAAEVIAPAVGFPVILSQSVWDAPRSSSVHMSSCTGPNQASALTMLTKEETLVYARLRAAVSTGTVLTNLVGTDDELTRFISTL